MDAAPPDPQIADSVGRSVPQLTALGHRVESGPLPLDLGFFADAWPQVGQIGLARMFEAHPEWDARASEKYRALAEMGRRVRRG